MSVISPSAAMVNGVNKRFAPQEEENFAVKGGRVFARAVANTALTVAALTETVVFTVLTAATFIFKATNLTKPVFNWANEHRSVAANATKNALAGIIGRGDVATPKTAKEKAKETVETVAANVWNFAKANYNNKYVVRSVAFAAIALTAYYFNVHGMTYNAGAAICSAIASGASSTYNGITWAAGTAKNGIVAGASHTYNGIAWAAGTAKNGTISGANTVWSNTFGYFFGNTATA